MNIEQIFAPYLSEGCSCYILSGRDIYDAEASHNGEITSIIRQMAEYAHAKLDMTMIRYSLSEGCEVPYWLLPSREERASVKKALSDAGIASSKCSSENCNAGQNLISFLTGIKKLTDDQLSNGHKFAFVLEFSSNLIPNANSEQQRAIREIIFKISRSRNFIESGNVLILSDISEGRIDEIVQTSIPKCMVDQPSYEEKLSFLKALHVKYPSQQYEDGLNDKSVANLTAATPNFGLENLFRCKHAITAQALIERKTKDIEEISEGTCTVLDASQAQNVHLVGHNIEVPMMYLERQAKGLAQRDKATATNVLLAGAPGTAKTMMCMKLGLSADVPILKLNSPKNGIVGETERKVQLQSRILSSFNPSIAFVDELTEVMPSSRGVNLDAGATDAVLGGYLSLLSDNSREGRNILLGTTNCPWRLGAAFLDRITVVPVVMPSEEDFPDILSSLIYETSGAKYDSADSFIRQAAHLFYQKHLMPRRMRAVLKFTNQTTGINPMSIIQASEDANPLDEQSWMSAIYADLNALYYTVTKQLLPWYCRNDYPFPKYILDILDSNMEIDSGKLYKEIQRLKPYVNV